MRQPTEENGKNGLPDVLQAQEGLRSKVRSGQLSLPSLRGRQIEYQPSVGHSGWGWEFHSESSVGCGEGVSPPC